MLQYDELAPFAARVQGLKLSAWEISTCLREIMVETVIARQIEVRLYAKASGLTFTYRMPCLFCVYGGNASVLSIATLQTHAPTFLALCKWQSADTDDAFVRSSFYLPQRELYTQLHGRRAKTRARSLATCPGFFRLSISYFISFCVAVVFCRLTTKQADKADGPEDKTFKSPLQAVLFSGKMEGRFRLFIARTKASNRYEHRPLNSTLSILWIFLRCGFRLWLLVSAQSQPPC